MNVVGVDVGATKIAAGVVSPEGKVLGRVRYPTARTPEKLLSGGRQVASERPDSALGRPVAQREVLGEDVTRLARDGDEAALSVLKEVGRWLGIGLAGFVNVFNPDVVVVGGGAMKYGEPMLERAREEIHLRALPPGRDLVEVKEANLSPNSGVIGAAALAKNSSGTYLL